MWMTTLREGIFQYCGWIFTANNQLWYNCVSTCTNGATAILGHTEDVQHRISRDVRTLHDSPWISCSNLRLKQTKFWIIQHWILLKLRLFTTVCNETTSEYDLFLDAIPNLRNGLLAACPFVCPNGTTRLPPGEFSWNFELVTFIKICS